MLCSYRNWRFNCQLSFHDITVTFTNRYSIVKESTIASNTTALQNLIGLLQQTTHGTKSAMLEDKAHYYSSTGTLKQRDLNQSSLTYTIQYILNWPLPIGSFQGQWNTTKRQNRTTTTTVKNPNWGNNNELALRMADLYHVIVCCKRPIELPNTTFHVSKNSARDNFSWNQHEQWKVHKLIHLF